MRLLLSSLLALTPACSVVNGDHCGNLDGDATCTQRDPSRPHCSICVADNEGCLAEAPPASCVASTTPQGTTAAPATVTTDAPTTGPDSTTNPGTSTTLDPSTTTAGTAEPDTTTIASTTGGSTTGGPVCGNDIREGEEVCDGDDLAEQTCASLLPDKWGGGKLACNACASFNDTECCIGLGQACDLLNPDEACCVGLTCEMVLMPVPGTFCQNS